MKHKLTKYYKMDKRQNSKDNNIVIKAPSLFYSWIILSMVLLIILLIDSFGFKSLLYAIIFSALYYKIICNYSGRLIINNDIVEIKYLLPFHDDIIIDINSIEEWDYQVGFLNFSEKYEHIRQFKMIFYGTLFLKENGNYRKVNVLTKMGGFKKLIDYLRIKKGSKLKFS